MDEPNWLKLIRDEARAEASRVVQAHASEIEVGLSRARELLQRAGAAQAQAEGTVALAAGLRDALGRAPHEVFLSQATLALAVPVSVGSDRGYDYDEQRALETIMGSNTRPRVLAQRQAALLPEGRYAVLITFHRLGDAGKAVNP